MTWVTKHQKWPHTNTYTLTHTPYISCIYIYIHLYAIHMSCTAHHTLTQAPLEAVRMGKDRELTIISSLSKRFKKWRKTANSWNLEHSKGIFMGLHVPLPIPCPPVVPHTQGIYSHSCLFNVHCVLCVCVHNIQYKK